jgi:hypothetical protein
MTSKIIKPIEEYHRRMELALAKAPMVKITQEQCDRVKTFGTQWADNKMEVGLHYTPDSNQIYTRNTRGHLGQVALENYLGMQFTDYDPIFDLSKNIPDLEPIGLRYGVKTNRPRNPFMIFRNSDYPEILITQDPQCELTYYILGLFPTSLLNHPDFVCTSLIYDDQVLRRGSKIGFFGVDLGKPFSSYDDLVRLAGDKWIVENCRVT